MKAQPRCTKGKYRRIARWEHEDILDVAQQRLEGAPEAMKLRRQTVEHVFGTLKAWMGPSHFLTRTLPRVRTEMSLQVLAYNLKRAINPRCRASDGSHEGIGHRPFTRNSKRRVTTAAAAMIDRDPWFSAFSDSLDPQLTYIAAI